jgi:hypothetical protein
MPLDSISELRKKVQVPVRKYNDIAGLVVGDRVSIHVTRFFVALGISPTVATLSMLVFGVVGSVLLLFGEASAVAGFACLFVYYILDCVDGEVARYHRREKLIWGFHEFLFHLYVKSAFFVCLGIYAARTTGKDWMFFFGLSALLATLFHKFLLDLTLMLTCRYVLLRNHEERERFVEQLVDGAGPEHFQAEGDVPGEYEPYAPRGVLPFLRTSLTNFDLGVLLFLAAAVLDLFFEPFLIWEIQGDFKIALLMFYGVILPLDFFDRLQGDIRSDRFLDDSRRLLRRAHHFKIKG